MSPATSSVLNKETGVTVGLVLILLSAVVYNVRWATNVSRLPQKVRQLPPAPAKPVVNWRSDTRGRSYGAVEGAVQGQPLATSEELRRWGFI